HRSWESLSTSCPSPAPSSTSSPVSPWDGPDRFSPAKMSTAPPHQFPSPRAGRFSPAKIPAPLPVLLALLGLFTLLAPRALRVNVTPSLPLGLYRVTDRSLDRGALV